MKTAEEILSEITKGDTGYINVNDCLEAMKAYAQQEREQAVEVALRVASEKATEPVEIYKSEHDAVRKHILSLAPQIMEELNKTNSQIYNPTAGW